MTAADTLTLLFAGDVHLGARPPTVAPELRSLAAAADIVVVNLESPLTTATTGRPDKNLHIKSDPCAIRWLRELSVKVACLANNHILDFGDQGLRDTLDLLDAEGMRGVGAGFGPVSCDRIVIGRDEGGPSIGLIVVGAPEIGTRAPPGAEGRCALLDPHGTPAAVDDLRCQVDHVIVVVHWGYTNYHYPLPEHASLARRLLDAGAAAVIGHHPHVVQGWVERRSGTGAAVMVFSLGNLVFASYGHGSRPAPQSAENDRGMLCHLALGPGPFPSLALIHTVQRRSTGRVELLSGRALLQRGRFLARLSAPIARPGYDAWFRRYVLRRLLWRGLRWLHPARWASFHPAHLQGIRTALRRLGLRGPGPRQRQ